MHKQGAQSRVRYILRDCCDAVGFAHVKLCICMCQQTHFTAVGVAVVFLFLFFLVVIYCGGVEMVLTYLTADCHGVMF